MAEAHPEQPDRLVLVEDEDDLREGLELVLQMAGFEVTAFNNAEAALAAVAARPPDLVLSDLRLPGANGLEMLSRCRQLQPDLPVVLMTGHGDVPTAVEAIRNGAYDFIEKPFNRDRLLAVVARGREQGRLLRELRRLREQLAESTGLNTLLYGNSPAIRQVREYVISLAPKPADVLIIGETGTGKELVARALHDLSGRTGNFVAVNCAALPENLIESELFGHEAGAFTGAARQRIGKLEHAQRGTLFLDEVEAMPLPMQAKLLRVLQEREVERLGGNKAIRLEFRMVAAANVELEDLVEQGRFRSDLYYRLNVVPIRLPALRERRGDILLLFQHFLNCAATRYQAAVPAVPAPLVEQLQAHRWPGNVRELKSAAERLVLGMPVLVPDAEAPLPVPAPSGSAPAPAADPAGTPSTAGASLQDAVDDYERRLIEDALRRHRGAVNIVCEELRVPTTTLYRKLKNHHIELEQFRG